MATNRAPTLVLKRAIFSLPENRVSQGTLVEFSVVDDGIGANTIWLSGPDADLFEYFEGRLWLTYTPIDYDVKNSYSVTINVDDPTVGSRPDASVGYTLSITNVTYIDGTEAGETIVGTADHDQINGYGGDDVIRGLGGSDDIYSWKGADKIYGGDGNDDIYSSIGNDEIWGEAGNDHLTGGGGDDRMYGGDGNDDMSGDDGDDRLYGGAGADTMYGSTGRDRLYGEAGDDLMYGVGGSDRLYGGDGNDRLYGNQLTDTLYGDAGDDTLTGGEGTDTLAGGPGDDKYYIEDTTDVVIEAAGEGSNDRVYVQTLSYTLARDAEVELLRAGSITQVTSLRLVGSDTANTIHGDAGNNKIYGLGGIDTLTGYKGNDLFMFGSLKEAGDKVTDFGRGDDKFVMENTGFGANVGTGSLKSAGVDFVLGRQAKTANETFIYDRANGNVYWDVDGTGSAARTLLVTLLSKPTLTDADFAFF